METSKSGMLILSLFAILITPRGHMSSQIMAIDPHILCYSRGIPLHSPEFYTTLVEKGWGETWSFFATNLRGPYRSLTRPWKSSEPSVIVPCPVTKNIGWQLSAGKSLTQFTSFILTILNCLATEESIKNLLKQENTFYPHHSHMDKLSITLTIIMIKKTADHFQC